MLIINSQNASTCIDAFSQYASSTKTMISDQIGGMSQHDEWF